MKLNIVIGSVGDGGEYVTLFPIYQFVYFRKKTGGSGDTSLVFYLLFILPIVHVVRKYIINYS